MMKTIVMVAVLGATMTSGYARAQSFKSPATKEPKTLVKLTPSHIKVVENGTRKDLKDPDSAKFRSIRGAADEKSKSITVCGFVNAKNSYGGYTGDTPFMGMLFEDKKKPGSWWFLALGIGGTPHKSAAIVEVCQRDGLM